MRPVAYNQDVKALLANRDVVEPNFLTYALLSLRSELLGLVHTAGHGTGVLATDQLAKVQLLLPPLSEQRRIAELLLNLDDLVDTNRKLVNDLDEAAGSVGRRMVLGAAGRKRRIFSDLADVKKGYSYKSAELVDGGQWLVNLKNVGRGGTFESRGFKVLSASPKAHHLVDTGSVVVAQTDLTQDREVIARPVRVRRGRRKGPFVASLDLAVVTPKLWHTNESLFAILATEDFRGHALGHCNGTTVLHMAAAALPTYMAPDLTAEEVRQLTQQVRPLREAADQLDVEAAELLAVRDQLLPLLMSGRVRVGDVAA